MVTCQYYYICGIHLAEIVSDFKMKCTHDSDMHTENYRAAINFKRFMYARLAIPVTVARRQTSLTDSVPVKHFFLNLKTV